VIRIASISLRLQAAIRLSCRPLHIANSVLNDFLIYHSEVLHRFRYLSPDFDGEDHRKRGRLRWGCFMTLKKYCEGRAGRASDSNTKW
jgi:hypothetical protein